MCACACVCACGGRDKTRSILSTQANKTTKIKIKTNKNLSFSWINLRSRLSQILYMNMHEDGIVSVCNVHTLGLFHSIIYTYISFCGESKVQSQKRVTLSTCLTRHVYFFYLKKFPVKKKKVW